MKFKHSDNPAYIAEVLGQRLKRARLNRDMTQVEVADRAWVSKRTVLKVEM